MIYLNDLPLETNKSLLDFFADELTMTLTGTSVEGVSEDLLIGANRTVGWCGRNGMVVHTGKTKAMLGSTVQRQPNLNHGKFNLQICDSSVPLSDKERLLGITVDNSLKWSRPLSKSAIHFCICWIASKYIWIYTLANCFSMHTYFRI